MAVLNQLVVSCEHSLKINGTSIVKTKVKFNYDSQYILVACGCDIKVFSIRSGECVQILKYHTSTVIGIEEVKQNVLQALTCSDNAQVVRWDYLEGKMLQVYDIPFTSCASFYAPTEDLWFICAKHKFREDDYTLFKVDSVIKKKRKIMSPVQPQENAIAFGFKGKFCVAVHKNAVYTYTFENKNAKRHLTGEREQLCVAAHPSDDIFATGSHDGRVVIWSNALVSTHPVKSVYHWHTLPVADLAFSVDGTYVYSGGEESALVKWNLFTNKECVLPRMGAPIRYVSVARSNGYVATCHTDNAIQIVDAQRYVVQVFQGLTKAHFQGLNQNVLPTGLLYDSHLKALVMNGKTGHLQFYDFHMDKQLFNLDITGRNFLSQERDYTVFNIDVQKAAIDDTGLWLATTEYWGDGETSPQIWLKFWFFDSVKQTFVLNTNVILPHNQVLNCILFRPDVPIGSLPLAVTTSNDGRFKIWNLSCEKEEKTWSCEAMGCYRNFPAGSACFSEDGSLLAVAFESAATLWTVETTSLKAVLCPDNCERKIKQLVFGHHSCCQYLISHDEHSLTVWNVLTLSIVWVVHNKVSFICSDKMSDNIAAFCKNGPLIIFKPNNPSPVHIKKDIGDSPVISALFVATKTTTENEVNCFHDKSQLFFVNENQNLITISTETGEEVVSARKEKILQNLPETPFGMLQAEKKISNVTKVEAELLTIKPKKSKMDNIISNPTLQDPVALCSQILSSLLIPIKRTDEEKHISSDKDSEKGSSDDEETNTPKKKPQIDSEKSEINCNKSVISTDFSTIDFKIRTLNFDFLKKFKEENETFEEENDVQV